LSIRIPLRNVRTTAFAPRRPCLEHVAYIPETLEESGDHLLGSRSHRGLLLSSWYQEGPRVGHGPVSRCCILSTEGTMADGVVVVRDLSGRPIVKDGASASTPGKYR
jgi:hypothetical protein